MTNFLGAGFVAEGIEDIYKEVMYLEELIKNTEENGSELSGQDEVKRVVKSIVEQTKCLFGFIGSLQCEPLVYTGRGSTEEVICMLEEAMSLVKQQEGYENKKTG